jgi:protein involved in polysaccharide export with SLBB domain
MKKYDAIKRIAKGCFGAAFALRLATVAILLAIVPVSFAQQQDTDNSPLNPDSLSHQAACSDPFGQCTTGASSPSSFNWPYPSADFPDANQGSVYGYNSPRTSQPSLSDPSANPAMGRPLTPAVRKPEPPTEFQLFVASSIGKLLPLYGSQLFLDVPTTFAPLDRGPVTPSYVIGPGDELALHAWGSVTFNLREPVDRDGNIYLPHFGELRVAGLKASELDQALTARIGQEFKKFELSATLGRLRSIQVLVVGRARRPGSYTVSSLSTLVNVLFASGGPSSSGSMRAIQLKRDGKIVTTLDLYQLVAEGDESKDASLLPGDVIYVPPAGPRVAVAGSVSQPAVYELREGDTVAEALKLAGGPTSVAAMQRAVLERVDANGSRHIQEFALDPKQMQAHVADGDILRISEIVPRFDNAVILRGNVANPGRYEWHKGMRIRDLIPSKESLVTREALSFHNELALTDNERLRARSIETQTIAASNQPVPGLDTSAQGSTVPETGSPQGGTTPPQENGTTQAATAGKQPVVSPDPQDRAGKDLEDQAPSSANSTGRSIAFDTGRPSEDFPRKNRIDQLAPAINWDYAVIARTNQSDMTTVLKPFHLGRVVLEHDDSENYELQPGDVVTIFSQADIRVPQRHQHKFVHLEGEFGSAGVYSVEPGETLRQLVAQAGGLTPDAYLFGSSFTRRSTRLQQQARLDEYAVQLEQEIDREAGNKSGSVVNPQEALVVSASLDSQRALVAKLRQMQATGRIVLNIQPDRNDISSIPDLPLEDGDVFMVPTRPASVAVVGAVYDQNAFLFESGEKVDHYLQLSGGATKSGDWRHAFVLRADGSVVSHGSSPARATHGLEHIALNPGDALIIPEQLNKTTFMRGLTDWSAIFSQFGLGAAAISVLK